MQPHASLVRSVDPANSVVQLAEVKRQCRVEHDNEDSYLADLIAMAERYVDGKGTLGRALVTQTWQQWVGAAPGDVRVLMTPFRALTAVHYFDAAGVLQEATLAEFEAIGTPDQTIVRPKRGFSWPTADVRPAAIRLTYTAGFGDTSSDVPATIRHAILMMVAHWYENRETVSSDVMVEVPYAAEHLLSLERVAWYG
jgi:uncharacterized phiE125 gp8 family phage protein